MPTELSATAARDKVSRLETQAKRARADEETRAERTDVVISFAATRLASNLIDAWFPTIGGLKPVLEIGGGLYALSEGMDPDTERAGLWLGGGLAASVSMVDKLSGFVTDTVGKFKNKAK